ncbi:helix-turn-helix domain-containing protein [Streptomyces sp. NPDC002773]|uniref:helix-turn-helix domain-containing protein n=1 Tax=Streptomyces sp. NPDC002773 TaxID=3154430 RepID=UPI00331C13F0
MRHYNPISATRPRPIRGGYIQTPGTDTTVYDIDWVAVERAINTPGCRVELNLAEKRAACLLMLNAGFSPREISTQLCIYQRQVERWRHDGKPLAIKPVEQRVCSIADCNEGHRAHGMCTRHYDESRRLAKRQVAA